MGYTILVVPKGSIEVLKIVPKLGQTLIQNFPRIANWLNSNLKTSAGSESECKTFFKKLYGEIPKDTNYFFVVEEIRDRNNNTLVESKCRVLGPGADLVDAYSTNLLFPQLNQNKQDPHIKEGGYFLKGRKDTSGELEIGRTEDPYDLTIRAAQVRSREKLQRLTLQIPTDQQPIPTELQTARAWAEITQTYSAQLRERQALDYMRELNSQYAEAEQNLYNNLKLYREYKEINARLNSTMGTVGLLLQLGSSAATTYQNSQLKKELSQIKDNFAATAKALNSIDKERERLNQRVNSLEKQQLQHLQRNHIPVNDIPRPRLNFQLY